MKVGLIGTGVMGVPMAKHIMGAGHDLFIYNRTTEKVKPLLGHGAVQCATPGEVAKNATVIISMVSDPKAVETVSMGSHGILENLNENSVHMDMSTISMEWANHMETLYAERGRMFVHCPVLGSKPQAEAGVLLSFAGGSEHSLEIVTQILGTFSKRVFKLESAKKSAALKLSANMLIGTMMAGISQSIVYAKKAGLDPSLFMKVLDESAIKSPYMMMKAEKIVNRDFSPQFFVDHLSKDLSLALEGGRDMGVSLPINAAVRDIFVASQANGNGKEDIVSIVKVLEQLSGITGEGRASAT